MKIAIVLPRGTHFSPNRATSIDLCVHDMAIFSRFVNETCIYSTEVQEPFNDVAFKAVPKGRNQVIEMARAAAADAPDIVIVHQHLPSALLVQRQLQHLKCTAPVLLHKHNLAKNRKSMLRRWLDRRAYNRFARIIWVSSFLQDDFLAQFPQFKSKSVRIWNGIDTTDFKPQTQRKLEVLFVGRASPAKGVLEAAKACAAVLPTYNGWSTHFILSTLNQNDTYFNEIKMALAPLNSRAKISCNLLHRDVQSAYEHAAISLMPSVFPEPFGRTAIEAFAGGSALISTLRGGLAEVVSKAGLPLKEPTQSEIETALRKLISNAELRQQLAQIGRHRAETEFDIRITAQQVDDLMEDLVTKRPYRARNEEESP